MAAQRADMGCDQILIHPKSCLDFRGADGSLRECPAKDQDNEV